MTEKTYRDVFDRINMNASRRADIRRFLEQESEETEKHGFQRGHVNKTNGRRFRIVRAASAAAFVMLLIMCIPKTRQMVSAAADYISGLFRFGDGTEVTVKQNENSSEVSFDEQDELSYIEVSDGRLYFTIDDIRTDITVKVSSTDYFRYEKTTSDGGRSVIFVGGSPERYGWIELLFDSDGRYITNRMNVPTTDGTNTEEWTYKSMHDEGVPTGNPEYDDLVD